MLRSLEGMDIANLERLIGLSRVVSQEEAQRQEVRNTDSLMLNNANSVSESLQGLAPQQETTQSMM
jgi:hypothetical protein